MTKFTDLYDSYKNLSYEDLIKTCINLKFKNMKLKSKYELMKYDYEQMQKRMVEHRKQITYKDETLSLYKNILFDKYGGRKCDG